MARRGLAAFRAPARSALRHQDARADPQRVAGLASPWLLAWAGPAKRRRLGIDREPLVLAHRMQQLLGGYAEQVANGARVVREATQALEERPGRAPESAVQAEG